MSDRTIEIEGICLRSEGIGSDRKLVVLVEIEGIVRRVIVEHSDCEISHWVAASGIRSAPRDEVLSPSVKT